MPRGTRRFNDPMAQPITHSFKFTPDMDLRIHRACILAGENYTEWVLRACEELLRREEVPFE